MNRKTVLVLILILLIALSISSCKSKEVNSSGVSFSQGDNVSPEPVNPEPANPVPDNAEPANPISTIPEPTEADPMSPESVSPNSTKAESVEEAVYVNILSVTTPVPPGSPVTLFARVSPGVDCDIKVGYKTGDDEAKALVTKRSNDSRIVGWSWNVNPSAAYGDYPITVTAKASNGQDVSSKTIIEIKPPEECKK